MDICRREFTWKNMPVCIYVQVTRVGERFEAVPIAHRGTRNPMPVKGSGNTRQKALGCVTLAAQYWLRENERFDDVRRDGRTGL